MQTPERLEKGGRKGGIGKGGEQEGQAVMFVQWGDGKKICAAYREPGGRSLLTGISKCLENVMKSKPSGVAKEWKG